MKAIRVLLALLLGVGAVTLAGTLLSDKQVVEARELSLQEMATLNGGLCWHAVPTPDDQHQGCKAYHSYPQTCEQVFLWTDTGTEECYDGYMAGYEVCTVEDDGFRYKEYTCQWGLGVCDFKELTGPANGTKYKWTQMSGACFTI